MPKYPEQTKTFAQCRNLKDLIAQALGDGGRVLKKPGVTKHWLDRECFGMLAF